MEVYATLVESADHEVGRLRHEPEGHVVGDHLAELRRDVKPVDRPVAVAARGLVAGDVSPGTHHVRTVDDHAGLHGLDPR